MQIFEPRPFLDLTIANLPIRGLVPSVRHLHQLPCKRWSGQALLKFPHPVLFSRRPTTSAPTAALLRPRRVPHRCSSLGRVTLHRSHRATPPATSADSMLAARSTSTMLPLHVACPQRKRLVPPPPPSCQRWGLRQVHLESLLSAPLFPATPSPLPPPLPPPPPPRTATLLHRASRWLSPLGTVKHR